MKKLLLCGLIAFSALATTLTSCGKYEDGPAVSLLTKKSRIVNTWGVEKWTSTNSAGNSTDLTSLVTDYKITFVKDGTYTITWGSFTDNGTWLLSDDKTSLLTTSSSANSTQNSDVITRLKSKELWTKHTYSNGDVDVVHYIQK